MPFAANIIPKACHPSEIVNLKPAAHNPTFTILLPLDKPKKLRKFSKVQPIPGVIILYTGICARASEALKFCS